MTENELLRKDLAETKERLAKIEKNIQSIANAMQILVSKQLPAMNSRASDQQILLDHVGKLADQHQEILSKGFNRLINTPKIWKADR